MSCAPRKPYQRVAVDKRRRHGGYGSLTYVSWYNMLTRCENPNATQFKYYGGKGVSVCPEWHDFAVFLLDVGERPSSSYTLDRYPDRDGNYEPSNVRWATQKEQTRHMARCRRVVRSDGIEFTNMGDAAESVNGNHKGVWEACNGKSKTHRGFGWRYA